MLLQTNSGGQVLFHHKGGLLRQNQAEQVNRNPKARLAQFRSFFGNRYGQAVGACFEDGAADGNSAVPVGVGFYDCRYIRAGRQ